MDQPIPNTPQNGEPVDYNALILAAPHANGLANVPSEVELSGVKQMMQTLFARMESLQQNQAIQLAGVHDRLDAVELELPLMQEQGALRMRDLESRVSQEIQQAGRSAVEVATSAATQAATAAATAAIQDEVASKLSSLAAQMELQRDELSQMRESKKQTETQLNRAILDIERLCSNLAEHPRVEPSASPYRARISEHIRKAALDLAPVHAAPAIAKTVSPSPQTVWQASQPAPVARVSVASAPAPKLAAEERAVPGFETWKRQFMKETDAEVASRPTEPELSSAVVICPQCYSDRTRPATHNRWDYLYRLARFSPHRCRSCSYRFYKRIGPAGIVPDDEQTQPHTPDAMETP